jgi:hypothetical protein
MTASAGYLGAAALLARNVDSLVVSGARDVHGSVAGRVHGLTDRLGGRMEHRGHDLVAAAVYGSIGLGLRGASRMLDAADHAGIGPGIEGSPAGRAILAAVNGLIGDELRDASSPMSFDAAFRFAGDDLPPTRERLLGAHPDASESIVVFVHGLCESDESWSRSSRPRRSGGCLPSYGERLAAERGWTPMYLRYNSGLPVAESGVALSSLMDKLVRAWPTPVRQIALVGHSMGGLVIGAACAVDGADSWREHVTDVVCLGTPHLGAPLERVVARGVPLLARLPETTPVANLLRRRSRGILDLRDGLAPHAGDPRRRSARPIRYHLVAGSLTASPRHPVALAIGDLLVQPRSALGAPRGAAAYFPDADVVHLPRAGHFDLLNHEVVHQHLCEWLAR